MPALEVNSKDPAARPAVFQWFSALTVMASVHAAVHSAWLTSVGAIGTGHAIEIPSRMLVFGLSALGMAAAARFLLRCPLLIVAAALLLAELMLCQVRYSPYPQLTEFLPVLFALGVAAIAVLGPVPARSTMAGVIARILAVVSWAMAWAQLWPAGWGDVMAASAVLAAFAMQQRGKAALPETWLWARVSTLWLVAKFSMHPWRELAFSPGMHGLTVPAMLFALPFLAKDDLLKKREARQRMLVLASALFAAWSTQNLVWLAGWKPVAVLWTVLGFVLVSTGLWGKLAALRHAGFALLAIAVAKLFVVDVWDFATFSRVTAFLALGVALVVLGFFYNRFAEVLKKLFESDEA